MGRRRLRSSSGHRRARTTNRFRLLASSATATTLLLQPSSVSATNDAPPGHFRSVQIREECPPYQKVQSRSCVEVSDYKDFKEKVEDIQKDEEDDPTPQGVELILCPFDIDRDVFSDINSATIETKMKLACSELGECRIRGGDTHLRVRKEGAEATIVGMKFEGADDTAVRILKKTPTKQRICDCEFVGNHGPGKGAGMKAEEGSDVFVGRSLFSDNVSENAQGAAIYSYGETVIKDSTFTDNKAQLGGAVYTTDTSMLKIGGCTFKGNESTRGSIRKGPAVFVEMDGGEYEDGGNNVALDNKGTCNGVLLSYLEDDDLCVRYPTNRIEDTGGDDDTGIEGGNGLSSPTDAPTSMPTLKPTASPTDQFPELNYMGEVGPFGNCEGDCDYDSQCKDDLECYQRSEYDPVPGCSGEGKKGRDYCIVPANRVEGTGGDGTGIGGGNGLSSPTDAPTSRPTHKPTGAPTKQPTPAPTATPTNPPTSEPSTVSPTNPPTSKPSTASPTNPPTSEPTASPSTKSAPTPVEQLQLLSYMGEVGPFGNCEGDCDFDHQCNDGLVCYKRSGYDPVPGCSGDGKKGRDYCIKPESVSPHPTNQPTHRPTSPPSEQPTTAPTASPTLVPTNTPTAEPTAEPTGGPTTQPTAGPTTAPTLAPTGKPTAKPTSEPTAEPTSGPTALPTAGPTGEPTATPTLKPTNVPPTGDGSDGTNNVDEDGDVGVGPGVTPPKDTGPQWPSESEPVDPPRGYFNYDPDSKYGPKKWEKLSSSDIKETPEYKYWNDRFGDIIEVELEKDLSDNYCDPETDHRFKQSPIDVKATKNSECEEYHQLRDRGGDFWPTDPQVQLEIGFDKLRMIYPNLGLNENEPDAPKADIPRGWGHHHLTTHVDILASPVHTIDGKDDFVGEYRLWHMHPGNLGAIAVTIMMEISPNVEKPHNAHLQVALNAWRDLYNEGRTACKNRRGRRARRGLRTQAREPQQGHDDNDDEIDSIADQIERELAEGRGANETKSVFRRRAASSVWEVINPNDPRDPYTSPGHWDPYEWGSIINTYWFYGYAGSLTEPPCTQMVAWRIMDKPMYISKLQQKLIQKLVFKYKSEDTECERLSNHFDGKVSRPVQPMVTDDNECYKCTCLDFTSDLYRADGGPFQCRANQVDNPPMDVYDPTV